MRTVRPASRRLMPACWAVVGGLLPLLGCAGYQLGHHNLYRHDIQTVHVPVIRSESFRPFLGERLTEAVVKEIELKTPYKVVGSPDSADSTLQARLLDDSKSVLAQTRFGDARELELGLRVQVAWINHRGQLLNPAHTVPIPAELVEVTQTINFVPEVGQSLATQQQLAIERLAEQIVAMMESPW